MKKSVVILSLILVYVCSIPVFGQDDAAYEEQFKVLTEKNIFSVNRLTRKFVPKERDDFEDRPKPKKYSSYILIGISSINDQWNAFFENIITGHCQIVKISDEFEGGTIENIDSDGVSFKRGEETIELVIGADMKGQTEVPYDETAETMPGSESSSGGTALPETSSPGSGSVLQKLLERRNKEIK